jgi:hypothetical protein
MLRWIIVFAMLSLLFSACDKCKLKSMHTISITFTQPVIHSSGTWSYTPNASLVNQILSDINSKFDEPKQLQLVQNGAEYIVTIDSIFCTSSQSTQTTLDPCWESGGWLHDQLFPQGESTHTLYSSSLSICFTIEDSARHLKKVFTSSGGDSQFLYLPPADSASCYPYEVRGYGDEGSSRETASSKAYRDFKCIISEWQR